MVSDYSKKLKDPRWQKRRLEILPNTDPWDYPDDLLVTLCEDCHEAEKTERPEFEKYLLERLRNQFFARDILTLAEGFNKLELVHAPEVVASILEWALSSPEIQIELKDRYFLELKSKGDSRAKRQPEGMR